MTGSVITGLTVLINLLTTVFSYGPYNPVDDAQRLLHDIDCVSNCIRLHEQVIKDLKTPIQKLRPDMQRLLNDRQKRLQIIKADVLKIIQTKRSPVLNRIGTVAEYKKMASLSAQVAYLLQPMQGLFTLYAH